MKDYYYIDDIWVMERRNDFMAYVDDNKELWESGQTAAEAIGKLVIRLQHECGLNNFHTEW